jgi:hypothetical protein
MPGDRDTFGTPLPTGRLDSLEVWPARRKPHHSSPGRAAFGAAGAGVAGGGSAVAAGHRGEADDGRAAGREDDPRGYQRADAPREATTSFRPSGARPGRRAGKHVMPAAGRRKKTT